MISISTSNLSYRIGVRDILTDVTFSLEDGDRLAIVGVNGSGKSTLMRLITGEYTPDDGAIYIAKDKTVGMLHQDDAFNILREEDGSPYPTRCWGRCTPHSPNFAAWKRALRRSNPICRPPQATRFPISARNSPP